MADSRPIPDPTVLTTEALLREIGHLKELHGEKFTGLDRALVAALAAVKEENHKTEVMFAKQIEGQNDKVDDLRDRVKSIEGRAQGVGLSSGVVFQAITIAVAIGTLAVVLLRQPS